jgi:predicted dehydrogenase
MHRRHFLHAALAGPLAAATAADPIPAAFLGASHAHAAAKVQTVRENPLFRLAGIVESDPKLRDKYAALGIPLLSRDELLQDAAIRVVVVDSDVPDHARDALEALEAGKHVHVEKPPSTDLAGLSKLLDTAARKRLLLQQGYMWRYHPAINAALDAARNGWLGEIFEVRGTINTLVPPEERPALARFAGGQLFELGCHLIDPLIRLLGEPVRVTSVLQKASGDGLADNTVAVFEYARALGIVTCSALQPGGTRQRAFEIFGSNGSAVVRPIEPPALQVDLKDGAGPYRPGPQSVTMPAYKRYVADFEALAHAVLDGTGLPVSAAEELRVQRALLAASKQGLIGQGLR